MENFESHSFAEVLRRVRKQARLTQAELAERIGAHRSTVSFWERGEYVPETLTTVLEIARVLQLNDADQRLLVETRFGTASILPWQNLPEPNPYFTGRDTLLETLHQALTAGEEVALTQPHAFSGLGGVGKTQAALAYAYRYRRHYHDIFWALAESPETLAASYASFAQSLRLEQRSEQNQQKVVEAVKRWLRDHKGWLLILDNVEDLSLVRTAVPTPRQGTVLLTTRRAETSPVARALSLDSLPAREGILFLLRRAGLLPLHATLEEAVPQQRAVAAAIVEVLAGLPLALDQAGAYIAETRCTLSDYLAILEREQISLLHRRGSISSDHPRSVAATFALAFEQVQQQSDGARSLLMLCTFLAPEAIAVDLFSQQDTELVSMLGLNTDQSLALNAALEILRAYSLVQREAEQRTIGLHRLVQAVQLAALDAAEQTRWAKLAVRLVSVAFPAPGASTWDRCQQLVPHVLVCAAHAARLGLIFPEVAALLNRAGLYLTHRAVYEQALPLLQQALAIREETLGPNHPDVAESLNTLVLLYLAQGKYEFSLPLLQRALTIREEALGPNHPDVADTLNNLASLYWALGEYAKALPLYQRALAIFEHTLGPSHDDVAWTMNSMAAIYRALGQVEQALPLAERALAIFEQAPGTDVTDVAWTLNCLGNLYRAQGRYSPALALYQRALNIREQTFGPRHPQVAKNLNDLAELYRAQMQVEQALPLAERALAIFEQALGPDHPDVAGSLNILAYLYGAQGELAKAVTLARRGLAIREQSLRVGHPDVATSLNTLATLLYEQGNFEQALPLAAHGCHIRELELGGDHPDVAESLITLARLAEGMGRAAEALPLYQRALIILERAVPAHPNTALIRQCLEDHERRMSARA